MNSLINFLVRFHGFFLFVFLEVVAVYLMVNYNSFHNQVYVNSSNVVSGFFTERFDNAKSYFSLKAANDSLAEAYNKYLNEHPDSYYSNKVEIAPAEDTLLQKKYNYIGAKVISNSTNQRNNMLTLNRGSRHGIQRDAGILCNGSIAGIVLKTSKNYSVAMSLLHADVRINAKFKRQGYFGSLVWEGTNPRTMSLKNIPRHARIAVGDTIVTNNFSDIFPPDIMIGIVQKQELDPGSNYHTIQVRLTTNFSNIQYVNIVQNLMGEERKTLEDSLK